jgi:hypothetical protein
MRSQGCQRHGSVWGSFPQRLALVHGRFIFANCACIHASSSENHGLAGLIGGPRPLSCWGVFWTVAKPARSTAARIRAFPIVGLSQRVPRRALNGMPGSAFPRRRGRARERVLHPGRVEGRAPALLVVPREVEVVALARHATLDERRAPSTGTSASRRVASRVTRSSRPRRSVMGDGPGRSPRACSRSPCHVNSRWRSPRSRAGP